MNIIKTLSLLKPKTCNIKWIFTVCKRNRHVFLLHNSLPGSFDFCLQLNWWFSDKRDPQVFTKYKNAEEFKARLRFTHFFLIHLIEASKPIVDFYSMSLKLMLNTNHQHLCSYNQCCNYNKLNFKICLFVLSGV